MSYLKPMKLWKLRCLILLFPTPPSFPDPVTCHSPKPALSVSFSTLRFIFSFPLDPAFVVNKVLLYRARFWIFNRGGVTYFRPPSSTQPKFCSSTKHETSLRCQDCKGSFFQLHVMSACLLYSPLLFLALGSAFRIFSPPFLQPSVTKWLALPYLSSAAKTKTPDRLGQPLPFQVFI
jgi:hypothetical protein